MRITDQIEFHNVADLVPLEHPGGRALYRYDRATLAPLLPPAV